MFKRTLAMVMLSMFWSTFLFAEGNRLSLDPRSPIMLVKSSGHQEVDEFYQRWDKNEDSDNNDEVPDEYISPADRWAYRTKLQGAWKGFFGGWMIGGLVGLGVTAVSWGAITAAAAGLGVFAPLVILFIAALIVGIFIAGGVLIGIPWGVAKVGIARGEHGNPFMAYLGAIVNALAWYGLATAFHEHETVRNSVHVMGLIGMFGMPIWFYNMSRPNTLDGVEPETKIVMPVLTVRF
ncbi:MAG: hypothetical protein PHD29_05600 [bacterium]|nr:hypothetical protein [bacterium]MDD5353617.1 hypothetical protein [bacterium]MDD5756497.1 hypothetical protein [bacterium]